MDSLRLEAGLLPRDAHEPVSFRSVDECSRYCGRFVGVMRERKESMRHPARPGQKIDKKALFYCCGTALGEKVALGDPTFDRHLDKLWLDLFGNVMVLFAPRWSDVSIHLTHGFPRRLVTEPHRGVLPGNITAAALVRYRAVRGLGLTPAELVLARATALRYTGKSNKPARLVQFMLRFGVDFLYLRPFL